MKKIIIVLFVALATVGFSTSSIASSPTEVYCGGEGKCCKSNKKGKKAGCDKKEKKEKESQS
jgi:hypothetical protein